jgi:FtsH-binding integral membrane protein
MVQNNWNSYDKQESYNDGFGVRDLMADAASAGERAGFITKTYLYVIGAIFALIGIEVVLFNTVDTPALIKLMMGSKISWLVVIALFMGVNAIANVWANSSTSSVVQHAGLGLYVLAEAVILLPILSIAFILLGQDNGFQTICSAGVATGGLFGLMTLAVFITRADFSFLRTALWFGGFALIGAIVYCAFFNAAIGPVIMYIGIALACGYILYDTSNVLHHYRTDQHVAAALALFAAIALLFWYILQLFLSFSRSE